jgi:hypothetical protein
MANEIKEILLHEVQTFNVDVKLDNSKYYSATLHISEDEATLEVFGEEIGNERIISHEHFAGGTIEHLECIDSRYIFNLFDLNVFLFTERSIYGADCRSAFHIKFTIKYFYLSLAHPSSHYRTEIFSSLKIYSPTITKWLGITAKQLKFYKNKSDSRLPSKDPDLLCEFDIEVENNFNINIQYNARWRRDYYNHNTISEFPPSLNVNFRSSYPNFNRIKQIVSEIISLFYVLTGQPVMIEKAFLTFPSFSGDAPFYLSGSEINGKNIESRDILFPYNTDHLFEKNLEEIFPTDSFRIFFSLDDAKKDTFRKFSIYDKIANKEEKFLGLFRIVEKLSYIESSYVDNSILDTLLEKLQIDLLQSGVKNKHAKKLTERFKQVNSQKINAESAILRFTRSLDSNMYNDIKILEQDIRSIVKIRNDITHCRPYSFKENEIEKFILILNYLSTIFLWHEIGLSKHSSFRELIKYLRYRGIRKEN